MSKKGTKRMQAGEESMNWIIKNFEKEDVSLKVVRGTPSKSSSYNAPSRDGMRGSSVSHSTSRGAHYVIICSGEGEEDRRIEVLTAVPEESGIYSDFKGQSTFSSDQDVLKACFLERYIENLERLMKDSPLYYKNEERKKDAEEKLPELKSLLGKYKDREREEEEKCREFLDGVDDSNLRKKNLERLFGIKDFSKIWEFVEHFKIESEIEKPEKEEDNEDPLSALRTKWGG
jgi:hypothetical protein